MELLVFRADKQIGPFSQEQLASMLDAGMIDPTDLAWHEELAEWTPLNQIFDLSPPVPEPEITAPQPEAALPEQPGAAADPEPLPAEPLAEAPVVAPQRPRPPDGFLAQRPAQAVQAAQPVRATQPAARAAVPVARPQPSRGAVPVRAGVPVAAGRTVTMGAVPRAASPVRAGVPVGVSAFGKAAFVHSGQPGSFGARLLAFLIDTILVSIAASLISWPLSYLMGGGLELPKQGARVSQRVPGSTANGGGPRRPPGPPLDYNGGRPKNIQRTAPDENMSQEEAMSFLSKIMAMVGRMVLMQVIILWLYYALMESSAKQGTLGKQWCGLLVTDMEGRRIGFGKASGRFFGKYVSAVILYIGFLMCLWTEKKQCLHDIMAGTQVLKRGA